MIGPIRGQQSDRLIVIRQTLESILSTEQISIAARYDGQASPESVSTALERDIRGKVLDNTANRAIIDDIEIALTTPDFDRAALRAVFANAIINNYCPEINAVLDRIRQRGEKILLDHVDLSKLYLAEIYLEHVSAIGADFSSSSVRYLSGADLTDANCSGASMAGAQLVSATVLRTKFNHANLTGANLRDAIVKDPSLSGATLSNVIFPIAAHGSVDGVGDYIYLTTYRFDCSLPSNISSI